MIVHDEFESPANASATLSSQTCVISGHGCLTFHPGKHPGEQSLTSQAVTVLPVYIETDLVHGLKCLSQQHGTTLYMTLVAAWAAVLARVSGQDDLAIDTLAMRLDLSDDPSVGELLARVRRTALAAQDHQDLPFEQVVDIAQPPRRLDHAPLFQVLFGWQSHDNDAWSLPGVTVRPAPMPFDTVKFDLGLALGETGEGTIEGVLNYATALFDATTIERHRGYLLTLLRAMVADATQSIARIDLLSTEEREQQLTQWNATETPYPHDRCIHQLFEQQVEQSPDAIALVFEDQSITYAQLNAQANRLARYLIDQGTRPGDCIVTLLERSAALVTAQLAILKAGATYVPIDPQAPATRHAWIIADCAARLVLTDTTDAVPDGIDVPVVMIASAMDHVASAPNPDLPFSSEAAAYVMYTSGSTGTPKGVLVPHRAVNRLIINNGYATFEATDRIAWLGNPAFDISTLEVWAPLLHGACLVVVTYACVLQPPLFCALLQEQRVTVLHLTAGLFSQVADSLGDVLARLRLLLVGGDAVDVTTVARVLERYRPQHLLHCYGPTESTTFATTCEITALDPSRHRLPIGRPIANTRIYLLDAHGQPVPVGVAGELYIGGAGVASGYLHRPELTAERFLPDPFSPQADARMYRTGDLARYLPDGHLEFLGRNDHQVKIRGYRIEPGEIEARLAEHPAIREAVVIAREDTPGDKRLVAYWVPRQGNNESAQISVDDDIQLWPSIGEYAVYDELIYHGLSSDDLRNEKYRRALRNIVTDKVVLDVGTGRHAILARLCVELGAKHVYAVDILEESYLSAKKLVADLGLDDKIKVHHGDARTLALPEKVDICVSEIVEAIGGAEGAAEIINGVRGLLKPGGLMIPQRSVTKIAAVSLPDILLESPAFTPVSAHYVQKIFDQVGGTFDIRLCIKNFPSSNILSTEGILEDLDFTSHADGEYQRDITLIIQRDGRYDGFVVWMYLYVEATEIVDILDNTYAWFPVYFPIHDPGIDVKKGDVIRMRCQSIFSDNGFHPDYFLEGTVERDECVIDRFEHASVHHDLSYRGRPFYRRLFADNRITVHAEASTSVAALLREHIESRLPDYMVPSAFVQLGALPLTPNGKLDRKALPAPEGDAYAHRTYEPPQGEVEQTLALIWENLLGVKRVSRHDNFFELGGHSLLAVRLLSRLPEALGVTLALTQLFAHPVLSTLAATIAESRDLSDMHVLPAIVPVAREGRLPLSFAQQRLWFLARIDGVSATYHMPAAWRVRGHLDVIALRCALDALVNRHESLRTVFVAIDGQPYAELLAAGQGMVLVEHDLRNITDAASTLAQIGLDEVHAPFDLEHGPLVRARLVRLAEDEYVFLLTQHHIVSDGWSIGVLFRELGTLYGAFHQGHADPLPALSIQYPDYAAWQRQWLTGERLHSQVAYWRQTLADAPVLLELPTDRPRPPQQSVTGATVPVVVDASLTAGLKALSQKHSTTLFMTVMAAWSAVLSRLSGQDDLIIGTPTANRGRAEIEPLIGFFVNTLAVRLDLSGEPDVEELLARVRKAALAAQEHQDLPFERVVEIAKPPRRLDHTPLFQVMLAWQNESEGALVLPGLHVETAPAPFGSVKFDLELTLGETGEGTINGVFNYATALFDAATIERHRGYLLTLLRAMVVDATQSVAHIDLLSPEEREVLLTSWNGTEAPYPRELCIHQLFEQQVARSPDSIAVVLEDQSVTYAELNAQANRLAHHLIDQGVQPDDRLAICVERSIAMVVSLLAILKAGGAYVPLDPAYPVERLTQILRDAQPRLLLCDEAGRRALGEDALASLLVLDVNAQPSRWMNQPDTNPDPRVLGLTSAHLAYVIYTSGSTGTPKGVMVEHHSLVHLALAQIALFEVTAQSRVLQFASCSFDASISEMVIAVGSGAALHLITGMQSRTAELRNCLEHQAITHATLPPALLRGDFNALRRLASLQVLVLAGEAPGAALSHAMQTGATVFNAYGPTEITVCAAAWRCSSDSALSTAIIGRPIANTRIYLLDAHGQPVPLGAVGELHVGGAGVARGYLNRPDLTAERFLLDPFSPHPGARMYRTGDLARYLPDGNIEFLGRNDQQVKIRGFRIEPGEIEARLAEHPAIREAVVVAREDVPGDKRLVAYVKVGEAAGNAEALAVALRAHLIARLPDYMVPTAFVPLETFPLTPNGKLDRKALPAPEDDAYARRTYEPPQGETERMLAALWEELLQVEHAGRHDNFFELGGHSLLAVRLFSRLAHTIGDSVPLATLYAHPELHALARVIDDVVARHRPATLPGITPVSRSERLTLSFAQQRLWFLAQLDGVSATYHMPMALRLRGHLDVAAWKRSLDTLFARHEALRTIFKSDEGHPYAELLPAEQGMVMVEHDLRGAPEALAQLDSLCAQTVQTLFDLTCGPLIRTALIRMTDEEYAFVLTQHHIVSDGWSMAVFARELSELYRAFVRGQPNPLPSLTIQYPDYAAWQRQWLSGERQQTQVEYWRRTLTGAPVLLELPTDRRRPPQQSFAGAMIPMTLDASLTAGLKRLSQQHGTTLFMTVMAAWAAVLSRLSGQDDLVIGTPTANRGRTEIEPLVGFFVNTLAVRIDLSGEPHMADVLARVREATLAAQEHQDLPFEQVVEVVQPPRRLDHTPLFQVMFVWHNNEEAMLALPGLQVESGKASLDVAKFDISLSLGETDGCVAGMLNYATALFDAATMERHRGYLVIMLQAMVADADIPISCVDLLSSGERELLLTTWNQTEAPYPADQCIHQLFEQQVEKTPNAVALVYGDESLTYAQLNAQANQLAHQLIEWGVRPDSRVAICVERSLAMMVGLLAILKAGGAYVPLDPAYPAERLTQIMHDAAPVLLLCDAAGRQALDEAAVEALTALDLDTALPARRYQPNANPNLHLQGLTSAHLAYVIYTSGSTGMPKGVAVEHRNLVNHITWQTEQFGFSEDDCFLQRTSPAFDASAWELWTPLVIGARLALLPSESQRDIHATFEAAARQRVTIMQMVPSLLNTLTPSADLDTGNLRYLFCGGEPLSRDLLTQTRHLARQGLINLYGPTETTIDATAWQGDGGLAGLTAPIGRPIANTRIYLLDQHGQPVPRGTAGELYIGGAGVARGYLNRPGLTAERFLDDPFTSAPSARMYRTGDLARYLPDGNLEFLGRNDDQVKVRGFRIEPGEIEACVIEHPVVHEAVVLAREDVPGDKRLVAYVTTLDGGTTGHSELAASLRTHIRTRLPDYMVPAAFVRLHALPLTPNGKLDRRALPAPGGDSYAHRAYEPPQGEIEQVIAALWGELLGVQQVSRHDNFFELGGHSLLAVRLLSRLKSELGVQIGLSMLFKYAELAAFSEIVLVSIVSQKFGN